MSHPYTRALFAASNHQPQRHGRAPGAPVAEIDRALRRHPLPRPHLFAKREFFTAVNEVSLAVRRGENVGLVGESGCGKSTLARAILALEPLQGGAVRIGGEDFRAGGANLAPIRRQVQAVFQDPYGSFNPRWRVGDLVAEPFHLLDPKPPEAERRARVGAMLERVGLSAADAAKYPHEFSGGQRQRIAIARALIAEPSLVILDEAVSALDVSVRARILDLLADLSDRLDVSYLFISHDLHVVRAVCDRVMVMQAGEIVEAAETEDLFSAPRHPYTRALLAAAPNLAEALAAREAANAGA